MFRGFKTIFFDDEWNNERSIDILIPKKIKYDTAYLVIHGGGHIGGNKYELDFFLKAFGSLGCPAASTNYRLGPLKKCYQKQIEDVRKGYEIFLEELFVSGITNPRMVVFGSSAGAELAAMLSYCKPGTHGELCKKNVLAPDILIHSCGPITYIPWSDAFSGAISCANTFSSTSYEKNPDLYEKLSMVKHISKNSPDTLFVRASNEHIFPNEQIKPVVEKLHSLGIRAEVFTAEPAEHGFLYSLNSRVQKEAWVRIKEFTFSKQV